MNLKQKAYEYKDYTSKRLKLEASFFHNLKLFQIKNRKSLLIDNHTPLKTKSKRMGSIDKTTNNSSILKKLIEIANKAPKPEINNDFCLLEKNRKMINLNRIKHKRKVLDKENSHLYKRIINSQSFISAKTLDRQYSNEHIRLMTKFKKVKEGDSLLPRIEKLHKDGNHNSSMRNLRYVNDHEEFISFNK